MTYMLKVESQKWTQNRDRVLEKLRSWGYDVEVMRASGLDSLGYYVKVPGGGLPSMVKTSWKSFKHWRWLRRNAPLEKE